MITNDKNDKFEKKTSQNKALGNDFVKCDKSSSKKFRIPFSNSAKTPNRPFNKYSYNDYNNQRDFSSTSFSSQNNRKTNQSFNENQTRFTNRSNRYKRQSNNSSVKNFVSNQIYRYTRSELLSYRSLKASNVKPLNLPSSIDVSKVSPLSPSNESEPSRNRFYNDRFKSKKGFRDNDNYKRRQRFDYNARKPRQRDGDRQRRDYSSNFERRREKIPPPPGDFDDHRYKEDVETDNINYTCSDDIESEKYAVTEKLDYTDDVGANGSFDEEQMSSMPSEAICAESYLDENESDPEQNTDDGDKNINLSNFNFSERTLKKDIDKAQLEKYGSLPKENSNQEIKSEEKSEKDKNEYVFNKEESCKDLKSVKENVSTENSLKNNESIDKMDSNSKSNFPLVTTLDTSDKSRRRCSNVPLSKIELVEDQNSKKIDEKELTTTNNLLCLKDLDSNDNVDKFFKNLNISGVCDWSSSSSQSADTAAVGGGSVSSKSSASGDKSVYDSTNIFNNKYADIQNPVMYQSDSSNSVSNNHLEKYRHYFANEAEYTAQMQKQHKYRQQLQAKAFYNYKKFQERKNSLNLNNDQIQSEHHYSAQEAKNIRDMKIAHDYKNAARQRELQKYYENYRRSAKYKAYYNKMYQQNQINNNFFEHLNYAKATKNKDLETRLIAQQKHLENKHIDKLVAAASQVSSDQKALADYRHQLEKYYAAKYNQKKVQYYNDYIKRLRLQQQDPKPSVDSNNLNNSFITSSSKDATKYSMNNEAQLRYKQQMERQYWKQYVLRQQQKYAAAGNMANDSKHYDSKFSNYAPNLNSLPSPTNYEKKFQPHNQISAVGNFDYPPQQLAAASTSTITKQQEEKSFPSTTTLDVLVSGNVNNPTNPIPYSHTSMGNSIQNSNYQNTSQSSSNSRLEQNQINSAPTSSSNYSFPMQK